MAARSAQRELNRLRLWLVPFFCALALPAGLLTLKAYDQLKWEALRQSQLDAEGLAARIDARLGELIRATDARAFSDFSFLTLAGAASADFVQRSPLSDYPPAADGRAGIPGLIGWFQVDDRGRLSTPLLPEAGVDVARYGLSVEELPTRQALEARIGQILDQNALARGTLPPAALPRLVAPTAPPAQPDQATVEAVLPAPAPAPARDQQGAWRAPAPEVSETRVAGRERAAPALQAQAVFDRLAEGDAAPGRERRPVVGAIASVEDLRLEEAAFGTRTQAAMAPAPVPVEAEPRRAAAAAPPHLARKSQALPGADDEALATADGLAGLAERPEGAGAAINQAPVGGQRAAAPAARSLNADAAPARPMRPIRTFDSEIEPFRFSLLDSGHFVLYRNAWRDGARVIQGALIERAAFLEALIGEPFRRWAPGRGADLSVAWGDDVLAVYVGRAPADTGSGRSSRGYAAGVQIPRGTLLYRDRPQAPFGELRLIFSVARLPVPPGAALIHWLAAAFGLVLCLGTWLLYRLGARQIALVRQQQAFVSAVSHELKTPLTSIRMYSEMLREGWVIDAKRPDYYRLIHDESERLSRLIANVLQLARMSRNETRVDPRPMRLDALLALARERIAPPIAQARFTLAMDDPEPSLAAAVLNLDPDAFVQVLLNLTDNAIKFSAAAECRRIDIGCARLPDGRIEVRIRDYGPGIPRAERKRVFQLFYRIETNANRGTKGTGIGLALVRQLTLAMGGEVDLIGREPGVEVRLRFPVEAEPRG